MPAPSRPPACDIAVFGGTGDLAIRKLLPALYLSERAGQLASGTRVIAISRAGFDDVDYRVKVAGELPRFLPAGTFSPALLDTFVRRLHHVSVDVDGGPGSEPGWLDLAVALARSNRTRVFYLAAAPALYGPICAGLARHDLITDAARVVLEKPIGHDLASARKINDEVGAVFREDRIFRIDHYLGKESVQNLLVLRLTNALFESVWHCGAIDHVQITVSETLGVGGRADYYDRSGALRDMVQNHLVQLLCLVAMEPPEGADPESIRDAKLAVLQALRRFDAEHVRQTVVRGRYTAGALDGDSVPGYLEELGAHPSDTETFVALKAEVLTPRWVGTPFYLRTGKRLDRHAAEIVIEFRALTTGVFRGVSGTGPPPNRLIVTLQPDARVRLTVTTKEPGPGGVRLHTIPLDADLTGASEPRPADAYERLLSDVLRGDPTLFMRCDEVEAAWTWIDPIQDAWRGAGGSPHEYSAGSNGPAAATALLARDGRTWHQEPLS
ncbi:glucose-6-phosphate dehydrogenase [Nocardia tengchongensis]|uniref:glucose-6-phosphate dehydrogenase n=1 Tax=Nocardia tengchongensis TaxID=2055889 RepID=UPI0036650BA0